VVAIHFYQPGAVDISFDFPTEWNELLPEELEAFARCQLTEYAVAGQDKAEFLRALITIRARLSGKGLPGDFFERLSIDDAVTSGFDLLNFLYEKNELTKQPYPILEGFTGPADDFNSIICGEYEDCDFFFNQFREEPAPEPLARLAAVLFRPKGTPYLKWNGKANEYERYDIEKVLPKFLAIDGAILYTVFIWFTGCRNRLPLYFPTAFKSDGSASDEPDFTAFTQCIHGAAGPKNGTREKVRTLPLKELFFDLEQEAKKVEDYKKEMARLKR